MMLKPLQVETFKESVRQAAATKSSRFELILVLGDPGLNSPKLSAKEATCLVDVDNARMLHPWLLCINAMV